jgi:hypothetical protein
MSQQTDLYKTDFFLWTQHQAALLREGKTEALDWKNLAEEIASLGKSDRRALISQLERLLMHLLTWRYQPEGRQTGQSWRTTIRQARREIAVIVDDSPSLRRQIPVQLPMAYAHVRLDASDTTGLPLPTFPEICPWTIEQILDAGFWPETGQEG